MTESDHDMRKTRNILMTEFFAVIIISLSIVALYESDVLVAGKYAAVSSAEFAIMTVMELVTLLAIPLSLRLFKFGAVRRALATGADKALARWGTVRIMLLGLPMVANTLLYYQFMSTTFGYMAIILLLCLPFVFPALGKCYYEVSVAGNDK